MKSLFVIALIAVSVTSTMPEQNLTYPTWRKKQIEQRENILDETLRRMKIRHQMDRERKLKLTQHVS